MFCQNCGNELRQDLKYCNRCGARALVEMETINDARERRNAELASTLSYAAGFIGFAGVVAIAYSINQLLFRGEISPSAMLLMLMFAVMILGIVFMLIVTVIKLSATKTRRGAETPAKFSPPDLPSAKENQARLEEYRQPAASVTEFTTRNFDESFVPRADVQK